MNEGKIARELSNLARNWNNKDFSSALLSVIKLRKLGVTNPLSELNFATRRANSTIKQSRKITE